MSNIKLRVVLDVEIDPQGMDVNQAAAMAHRAIRIAMSTGSFTQSSDATVEDWKCKVSLLDESVEQGNS